MSQRSQPAPIEASRSPRAPAPFFPVVMPVPGEPLRITDSQFAQLEEIGGVELSQKHRTALNALAESWICDLLVRRSARPKQFQKCLERIVAAFAKAEKACRLDERAGSTEYHLLHWAMNSPLKHAQTLPFKVMALEQQIRPVREAVIAFQQCLATDPGHQRPFDDKRNIIYLAEMFEKAGGRATVFLDAYADGGRMADTPFRKFAQQYYSLLRADHKRRPRGLEEALRRALLARHAERSASS